MSTSRHAAKQSAKHPAPTDGCQVSVKSDFVKLMCGGLADIKNNYRSPRLST